MPPLLLKEDAEVLTKVFRVGVEGAPPPAASARGASETEPFVELTELSEELVAEANGQEPAARWPDTGSRRSLFDRALVGRLSSTCASACDYLIGAFARCSDLRSRKREVSAEQAELYGYVEELCVSYTSIALLNPSMFPQPPNVEAEGVLRVLPALREGRMGPAFLARLVARLAEDDSLAEFGMPLFDKLETEARPLTAPARHAPAALPGFPGPDAAPKFSH